MRAMDEIVKIVLDGASPVFKVVGDVHSIEEDVFPVTWFLIENRKLSPVVSKGDGE